MGKKTLPRRPPPLTLTRGALSQHLSSSNPHPHTTTTLVFPPPHNTVVRTQPCPHPPRKLTATSKSSRSKNGLLFLSCAPSPSSQQKKPKLSPTNQYKPPPQKKSNKKPINGALASAPFFVEQKAKKNTHTHNENLSLFSHPLPFPFPSPHTPPSLCVYTHLGQLRVLVIPSIATELLRQTKQCRRRYPLCLISHAWIKRASGGAQPLGAALLLFSLEAKPHPPHTNTHTPAHTHIHIHTQIHTHTHTQTHHHQPHCPQIHLRHLDQKRNNPHGP